MVGLSNRTQDDTLRILPVVANRQGAASSPRVKAMIMVLPRFRGRKVVCFRYQRTCALCLWSIGKRHASSIMPGSTRTLLASRSLPGAGLTSFFPRLAPFWDTDSHQYPEGPSLGDSRKARKI